MKHSDLWSVLAKTQQYISKYYASALTDESKHDQLKSYNERKRLVAETEELKREVDNLEQTEFNVQHWIDLIKRYASFNEINRPLVMALVDKIIVGDTHIEDGEKVRDIRIVYNFVGEVDGEW